MMPNTHFSSPIGLIPEVAYLITDESDINLHVEDAFGTLILQAGTGGSFGASTLDGEPIVFGTSINAGDLILIDTESQRLGSTVFSNQFEPGSTERRGIFRVVGSYFGASLEVERDTLLDSDDDMRTRWFFVRGGDVNGKRLVYQDVGGPIYQTDSVSYKQYIHSNDFVRNSSARDEVKTVIVSDTLTDPVTWNPYTASGGPDQYTGTVTTTTWESGFVGPIPGDVIFVPNSTNFPNSFWYVVGSFGGGAFGATIFKRLLPVETDFVLAKIKNYGSGEGGNEYLIDFAGNLELIS